MKKSLEKKSKKQTVKSTEAEEAPGIDMWTIVKTISQTKKKIELNEETSKAYDAYNINKAFSLYPDTIVYANEMNRNYFLSKNVQYDYLINSIRSKNRYAEWVKKKKDSQFNKDIDAIREYYGYSDSKARTALSILSEQQIAIIKQKLEKGGIVK